VARGELDLGAIQTDDEKKQAEALSGAQKPLIEKMKEVLGDQVKDVRITTRLTQSPSCLVADEADMGGNLARILKAAGQKLPDFKPILEINASHPIVARLRPEDSRFADWARLLLDQALLSEGGQLEDPAEYVKRSNELMLSIAGN
jgi:molecular chaperone HtpG